MPINMGLYAYQLGMYAYKDGAVRVAAAFFI